MPKLQKSEGPKSDFLRKNGDGVKSGKCEKVSKQGGQHVVRDDGKKYNCHRLSGTINQILQVWCRIYNPYKHEAIPVSIIDALIHWMSFFCTTYLVPQFSNLLERHKSQQMQCPLGHRNHWSQVPWRTFSMCDSPLAPRNALHFA